MVVLFTQSILDSSTAVPLSFRLCRSSGTQSPLCCCWPLCRCNTGLSVHPVHHTKWMSGLNTTLLNTWPCLWLSVPQFRFQTHNLRHHHWIGGKYRPYSPLIPRYHCFQVWRRNYPPRKKNRITKKANLERSWNRMKKWHKVPVLKMESASYPFLLESITLTYLKHCIIKMHFWGKIVAWTFAYITRINAKCVIVIYRGKYSDYST